MVFFLLSGFVVFYSTHNHKDQSFRGYFARRWKRIYPIFMLSLLVALLCAWASTGAMPDLSGRQLAGNLLMFQDFAYAKPGVFVSPFLDNSPLWSLSYEWWFYMMFFPIYRFAPPRIQLALVGGLSLTGFISYFAFPNQISLFLLYFILWWAGVELARTAASGKMPTFKNQIPSLAFLSIMTVLLAGMVVRAIWYHAHLRPGLHPVLELRHFASCLALLCFGLLWSKMRWCGFNRVFFIFLPLAPFSYALYVLHFPICANSTFLANWGPTWLQTIYYVAITIGVVFFAELVIQPITITSLNWMWNRLFKRKPLLLDGVNGA